MMMVRSMNRTVSLLPRRRVLLLLFPESEAEYDDELDEALEEEAALSKPAKVTGLGKSRGKPKASKTKGRKGKGGFNIHNRQKKEKTARIGLTSAMSNLAPSGTWNDIVAPKDQWRGTILARLLPLLVTMVPSLSFLVPKMAVWGTEMQTCSLNFLALTVG
ncbi:LOW QUALITY PROTEIN: hypothetical protein ACHAWO_000032 [Cyclotella atomus]|uniref:Uncharacterized protein n=1 Tax=Cyclotella atomus TaxID=382360 RepID=A0ABD3R296_9STRA